MDQSRKEPHVFGLLEPEQLQKKLEAGAAKNMRLLEDKKKKKIVHLLLFFRKIVWLFYC